MRGAVIAVLACIGVLLLPASWAASPAGSDALESVGLRAIAGWLKRQGVDGHVGADVADAIGIPRAAQEHLIEARQRGARAAAALRIVQFVRGEYLLFMVQEPGEVRFYLSTVRGGLRKALVSVSGGATVLPMEAAEAEPHFLREVLYWEDQAAR